jgi:hypothetical protein
MKIKVQGLAGASFDSSPFFYTLLLAGAMLFSPGWGIQRCAAQIFPGQGDDTTGSMGVFRITVDPAFRPLMNPAGALVSYTGYSTVDGKLTSPLCIDSATTIGRSAPQSRFYTFPVPVGAGSWDTIAGYAVYPVIPSLWAGAPAPTEEVLTEIRSFILLSVGAGTAGQHCPPDPRIPDVPLNWPMVTAGTGAGVTPRSIGMVQENTPNGPAAPDFPAHSFFDIFVKVNLPPLPGTVSGTAFPVTGAELYNDTPLVITNLNLTSFPPDVVYIHGETTAVPLKFKFNRPPYWSAGDIFGYLVLAGHGTTTNADCGNGPAVSSLLDATLGPIGTSAPEMPVEWLRPNTLCPSPGSSYDSVQGTNSDGSSMDVVKFPVPALGALFARNFSEGNLSNPIPPPPYLGTNYYNPSNTVATMELSVDGLNWFPALANGSLLVSISNNTPPGNSPFRAFDTEMLQLNLQGNSPFGPFKLRESPTKHSLGQHTIRQDPRGYRVSSFFDVFTEMSLDGGETWIPANRSIRVQASAPPAAPNSIFVTRDLDVLVLNWLGSFTLQSSPDLNVPFTDLTPTAISGPFIVPIGPGQMFFRLRQ